MAATAPWRRAFTIFYIGEFVAITGLAFAMFSLGHYIYYLSDSATWLGIAFALPILPFVLASPFAGSLIDRWGARRSMVVASIAGGVNLLVLAFFTAINVSELVRIVLFLYTAAALKALHLAAFDAAIPFLAPKRSLGRVNGTRMFLTAAGAVLGPVVSDPMMGAFGVYGVILMGCLSFAIALLTLKYVPIAKARREAADTADGPLLKALLVEFRWAWRYVTDRPGLAALLGCMAVVNFGIGGSELLLSQMTLSFTSYEQLGAVLSAGALGVAVGTVVMVLWGGPRRLTAGIVGFSMLLAGAMVLGSLRPVVPLLAVAAFLFLGSTPILIGTIQTLLQLKVVPGMLGRTSALKNVFTDFPYMTANIFAGLLAGLVFVPLVGEDDVASPAAAAVVGTGPGRGFAMSMLVVGLLIAAAILLLYRYSRLRTMEQDLPDVTPEDIAEADGQPTVAPVAGVGAAGRRPHLAPEGA